MTRFTSIARYVIDGGRKESARGDERAVLLTLSAKAAIARSLRSGPQIFNVELQSDDTESRSNKTDRQERPERGCR